MKRKRDIDFLRAVGIIVMIIDHIGIGEGVYKWSHAFHMPLFFIVSGYFFSEEKCMGNLKDYLQGKAKKLWIPYFVFALGSYFIWVILKHDRPVFEPLYKIFWYSSEGIPIATAVWFLPCLFFVEMMYCLCVRIAKEKRWGCAAAVLVIATAGFVLRTVPEIRTYIPFAILPGMICLPFFLIGHRFRGCERLKPMMDRLHPEAAGILLLLSIAPIFLNSSVNIRFAKTGNEFLFYFNAVCTTLLLWTVSRKLDYWVGERKISTWLASIGKNSIVYLCMNQMAITGCEIVAGSCHISTETALYKVLCFIVVMTILGIAVQVFTKTPLCVLVGGKYEHKNTYFNP